MKLKEIKAEIETWNSSGEWWKSDTPKTLLLQVEFLMEKGVSAEDALTAVSNAFHAGESEYGG